MLEIIWNSILPNIFKIVATIISLVVAYYVIPSIKEDLIPWLKEKRLHNIIKNFVQAAEKMSESGAILKESKKDIVIKLLEKRGIVVDETIDAFIESCVKELDLISSTIYEEIMSDTDKEQEEPELIIETEDI